MAWAYGDGDGGGLVCCYIKKLNRVTFKSSNCCMLSSASRLCDGSATRPHLPYPSNLISEKPVWNRASKGAHSRFCLIFLSREGRRRWKKESEKGKEKGLSAVWMTGKLRRLCMLTYNKVYFICLLRSLFI
jgi:hypothetical protein